MDAHVVEELRDIAGRLDIMISYTIIRFVYALCLVYLANTEIVLFGTICGIVFTAAVHSHSISNATRIVSELMRKTSLLVMAQALIGMLGVGTGMAYDASSSVLFVMQSMTVVTCILILLSVIPQYCQQSEVVSRCVTLLLYVYADATESLFRVVEDGLVPTLVCLLLYVAMHNYHAVVQRQHSLTFLMRAFNMVAINFILRSLSALSRDATTLAVQTVLYIVVLFVVDAVSHISTIFTETRDYAMWRVSQQLFLVYSSYNADLVLTMAGCILVLTTRNFWSDNTQLVFQLVLLVTVSVVLDAASQFLHASASMDKCVLLFVYVVVIHRLSSMVL